MVNREQLILNGMDYNKDENKMVIYYNYENKEGVVEFILTGNGTVDVFKTSIKSDIYDSLEEKELLLAILDKAMEFEE